MDDPTQTSNHNSVQLLIRDIVKAIVDTPEEVSLEVVEDTNAVTLRLRVHCSDLGPVIGKRGHVAHALRLILTSVSKKLGRRYYLEICE